MNIGTNIKENVFGNLKWIIYLVTEIFLVSCDKCYAKKKKEKFSAAYFFSQSTGHTF